MPSSFVRYAGGRVVRGVVGPPGLQERGDEKVRTGRGRDDFRARDEAELEPDDDEMTDAFLLRSAREGLLADSSGGVGASTLIIQKTRTG